MDPVAATPGAPAPGTPPAATPAATQQPPAPAVPAWVQERVPEAYRTDPNITKYASEEEFFKGHVNLAQMVGKKTEGLVKVPGADAKPDEVAAFRAALGVPEKADGYELKLPETLAGYIKPEVLDTLKPVFHALGLPKDTAGQLAIGLAERIQAAQAAFHAKNTARLQAEEAKVGPEAWAQQKAIAQQALQTISQKLGAEWLAEFTGMLDSTGLGNFLPIVQLLHVVGNQMVEGNVMPGTTVGSSGAEDLIAKCKDPNSAEWKILTGPEGPARQALLQKRDQAYAALAAR